MEFHEKLQQLRKSRGMTQEELAQVLFVSRTAVSKWESGRGYPSIDSLKAISKFYSVTIDELLSGEEVMAIAEEDSLQKQKYIKNLVFGLLDSSSVLFLILPFFGQKGDGLIREVSLLTMTEAPAYLKIAYWLITLTITGTGILTLKEFYGERKEEHSYKWSVLLNVAGVLLMIISLQPYAASFLFLCLTVKTFLLMKRL